MEQTHFNTIQNNFKRFLTEKIHTSPKKKIITEHSVSCTNDTETINLERTNGFGKDDDEVGYKISFVDRNGNRKTKIVPSL